MIYEAFIVCLLFSSFSDYLSLLGSKRIDTVLPLE
jgi:hypothetical protein